MMNHELTGPISDFTVNARRAVLSHLGRLPGRGVVHLAYCAHANPGDNAIAVAEDALFAEVRSGGRLRISDELTRLSFDTAIARIDQRDDADLVFSGGGGLNDHYPEAVSWTTRVLTAYPERHVLFLPMSIELGPGPLTDAFVAAVDGHPNVTMLCRDEPSRSWVERNLRCDVDMVPDSVLTGPPHPRQYAPRVPVAMIARSDGEASSTRGPLPPAPSLEWGQEPRAYRDPRLLPARLSSRLDVAHGPSPALASMLYALAARGRATRAARTVQRAEVIVTDRLHAMLIGATNGVRIVAVDSSSGKVHAAVTTWNLDELAPIRLADTFAEGVEIAARWR